MILLLVGYALFDGLISKRIGRDEAAVQSRAMFADMLSLTMKEGMLTWVQDWIQKVLHGETA